VAGVPFSRLRLFGRPSRDRWPVATNLVAASETISATMMTPSTSAVSAGMTRAKLPAVGWAVLVPASGWTSAAELGVPPTVGSDVGEISGRTLSRLPGLMTELLVNVAGIGPTVGAAAAAVVGAVGSGVRDGDGDGVAEAGAAPTVTDPVAAGIVAIGGLVAASAVAVSVTEVPEAALDAIVTCACI
jgi:hypothetical protein